ncbi:MAG: hypothetical protein HY887_08475, partial [Deltaproteobacteria bacterium]|nr:hypothetical protein [Deltaproteobacteria bacterium]
YGWIFPKKRCLSVGMAGDTVRLGGGIKDYFNAFVGSHEALKGHEIRGRDGWIVPVYYSGAGPSIKGSVLLAGDTGHLVDPFLGEGIYYAIRTGRAAAEAVIDCVKGKASDLRPYQDWIERVLHPEFMACEKMSGLIYKHPRLWYSILEKEPEIMQRFYGVIRGSESAESFYGWVRNRISAKPWKVIRRWLAGRLLPS